MKFSIHIKTYNGLLLWCVNFNKIMSLKTIHLYVYNLKITFKKVHGNILYSDIEICMF